MIVCLSKTFAHSDRPSTGGSQKIVPEGLYFLGFDQGVQFAACWYVVSTNWYRLEFTQFAGAIIGQVIVGLICDRLGRKVALVGTTLMIVIGAILGTAAHGAHGSPQGLFWFLTFARGITGIVCEKND